MCARYFIGNLHLSRANFCLPLRTAFDPARNMMKLIDLTRENRGKCREDQCTAANVDSLASNRPIQIWSYTILAVEIGCTCRLWSATCHPHIRLPEWGPNRSQRRRRAPAEHAASNIAQRNCKSTAKDLKRWRNYYYILILIYMYCICIKNEKQGLLV